MRIHTDTLSERDLHVAMHTEQNIGRIPLHVHLSVQRHGSRSHELALEVQLTASRKEQGDGRRLKNSGSYGAGYDYAATYDEWGWFIAAVYNADPRAVFPYYDDRADFNYQTGWTYAPERLIARLEATGEDPFPFYTTRTGGQAGGIGRGRSDGERLPRANYMAATTEPGKLVAGYLRYAPRTVEFVREFAKLDAVNA